MKGEQQVRDNTLFLKASSTYLLFKQTIMEAIGIFKGVLMMLVIVQQRFCTVYRKTFMETQTIISGAFESTRDGRRKCF